MVLFGCHYETKNNSGTKHEKHVGLLIIDAQKWYIPGHPESVYEQWGYNGSDAIDHIVTSAMDSVLVWANARQLPVFVTDEGLDTGRYDLPNELLEHINRSRTINYVKSYYAAPKHEDFNALLQQAQIDNWIIIGAETDVCVYQTAKELLKQGKKVTLINEAIYSGRNNTIVSRNNLASFGAHFISLEQLYTGDKLFVEAKSLVEQALAYEDIILTIFPANDTSANNGDAKRLKYLKEYAGVIGLKTEHPDSISCSQKIRLLAGDITAEKYQALKAANDILSNLDKKLLLGWFCHLRHTFGMPPPLYLCRSFGRQANGGGLVAWFILSKRLNGATFAPLIACPPSKISNCVRWRGAARLGYTSSDKPASVKSHRVNHPSEAMEAEGEIIGRTLQICHFLIKEQHCYRGLRLTIP